jgi:hypothetical protein
MKVHQEKATSVRSCQKINSRNKTARNLIEWTAYDSNVGENKDKISHSIALQLNTIGLNTSKR